MWIKFGANHYMNIANIAEIRISVSPYMIVIPEMQSPTILKTADTDRFIAYIQIGARQICIKGPVDIEAALKPYRDNIETLLKGEKLLWDLSDDPNVLVQ